MCPRVLRPAVLWSAVDVPDVPPSLAPHQVLSVLDVVTQIRLM